MPPQVDHDLQLSHQNLEENIVLSKFTILFLFNHHLDVADVCLRLDHLDCHGGGGLPAHDAAGLRLEHAAEGAGAEEDAEVEPLSGELKLPAGCNVKVWPWRWLWLYCL